MLNYRVRFIELADDINTDIPHYMATLVADALHDVQKSIRKSKILILGVTYKPDTNDIRESPTLDIIQLLAEQGEFCFHDPFIRSGDISGIYYTELSESLLNWANCVITTMI